jgi:hypothetical protein
MIQNITGDESCGVCLDDGWVELLGTVTVGGSTTPRGVTGCKWCEEGCRKLDEEYKLVLSRRTAPLDSDYGIDDVYVPATADWDDPKVRAAAKAAHAEWEKTREATKPGVMA